MGPDKQNDSFESRTRKLIKDVGGTESTALDGALDELAVHISAADDWISTPACQMMFLSTINLVGRFCHNISFHRSLAGVSTIVDFPLADELTLGDTAASLGSKINPRMNLSPVSECPTAAVRLGIGTPAEISISSSGWYAYLNWRRTIIGPSCDLNPFGPLMASCFASAEVFRQLIRNLGVKGSVAQRSLRDIRFSTLDCTSTDFLAFNPPFPSNIEIGAVLFSGCGAVAHGAVAALSQIHNLTGKCTFLDDELISASNVSRYFMSSLTDIGRQKPGVLVGSLAGTSVEVTSLYAPLETLSQKDIRRYSCVISGLDNRNKNSSRFHLQSHLPRWIIHTATHGLSIAVANIDFAHGACLGCLFSPRTEDLIAVPDPMCGGVILKSNDEGIAASVSFVSAASGILAASELVKRSVPELTSFTLDNYLSMSMMSPDLADIRRREKDRGCLCLCSEEYTQRAFQSPK